MLNNPRYGWVEIQISDFFGACSDSTNVPRDTLECFIDYYEKGCGEAYYDQEGSEFTIILENKEIMIIKEEPERSIYVYSSIDIKKLAKELVRDIKTNIDEWVWWNFDLDYDSPEQEIKEYKEELSSMCRKLSKLVGEK